jgi:hypothetical protein
MNTFDDDTLLSERLYRIGATAPVPRLDAAEDVRRGRRRVLRARVVATAGTVLAVGIIGIAGVALKPVVADRATDPAGSPTATSTASVPKAASVVNALPSAFDLAINLIFERDAALAGVPDVVLRPMYATTDESITTWMAEAEKIDVGHDEELSDVLARIERSLGHVTGTRSDMGDTIQTLVEAKDAYAALANDLLSISTHVPPVGEAEIDSQTAALANSQAIFESISEQREIMMTALVRGNISADDYAALAEAEATWRVTLADLYSKTSHSQRETLDQITFNTASDGAIGIPAPRAVNQVLSTGSLERVTMTPDEFAASCTELIRALHILSVSAANEIIADLAALD